MSSDSLVFGSIAQSNIPEHRKSAIRRWYEAVSGKGLARARTHAMAAGHAFRQGGEAVITGAALGALHAELKSGLDVKAGPVGSKNPTIPVDGVVAVLGIGAGIALAGDEVGTDLRNAGSAAAAVLSFRKTHAFMSEKKLQRGHAPGGTLAAKTPAAHGESDWGEDPIVAAARML